MPKVKSEILIWAREVAKLSIEDAAKKLNFSDTQKKTSIEKLLEYESGTKEPSRSLLLRMSNKYHQPLLTFYLDKPPIIGDRGEDFRTLPDDYKEDNAFVDILIRDVKARQSLLHDTIVDADEGVDIDIIGKYTINSDIKDIVKGIKAFINFDSESYRKPNNYTAAFQILRMMVEETGIFVILKGDLGSYHSAIDVQAFRGFALSDKIAPFIVINYNDAKSAWSFTLIHELTHLLLGQTGLSGKNYNKRIEKFCEKVASEFLLSEEEFSNFQSSDYKFNSLINEIPKYAYNVKVSSTHIAYKLYLRGNIDRNLYNRLAARFKQMWEAYCKKLKEQNKLTKGGPTYYQLKKYRLGALIEQVNRLSYSGVLSTTKAGMVLEVKPLKVHRLFNSF